MVRHRRDSRHLRVASRVADRSGCRMNSHDRSADQSHDYLSCNDFFGQGSIRAVNWDWINCLSYVKLKGHCHGRALGTRPRRNLPTFVLLHRLGSLRSLDIRP